MHAAPANPLAVNMALLEVLTALASVTPVLVVVDDAQWLDEPSLAALSFAGRRLAAEPVAIVVAARPDPTIAYAVADDAILRLGGLADDDARALLAERRQLTASGVDQLVHVSSGNPLALLELPDASGAAPDERPRRRRVIAGRRAGPRRVPSAPRIASAGHRPGDRGGGGRRRRRAPRAGRRFALLGLMPTRWRRRRSPGWS